MKKLNTLIITLVIASFTSSLKGQYFNGLQGSSYAGIHGLYANPSSISGSRIGVEVGLTSITADLIQLPFSDDNTKKYSFNNYAPNHISVLLPSVIIQTKKGFAFGVSSRSRIAYDFQGNKGLYSTFINSSTDFVSPKISSDISGFKAQAVALSDVGFTFAMPVFNHVFHNVTLGGTYRLLSASAVENYNLAVTNNATLYTLTGNSKLGKTSNIDTEGIKFDFKAGNALDLGFTYEYRPEGDNYIYRMDGKDRNDYTQNTYLLKFGFSINDIGEYKYDSYEATPKVYDTANSSKSPYELDDKLQFSSSPTAKTSKLPTRTNVNVDVKLGKKGWYLNTLWVNNLTNDFSALRQPSLIALSPRLEKKGFQLSVPITYYTALNQTAIGTVLRLGPFVLGSDNLSFLFQKNVPVSNLFAGFTIQIGRKKYKDSDNDAVSDKKDKCPTIAGIWTFRGCPDTDNDGVKDADDKCPDLAGPIATGGCPDSDGDGIFDKNDACPQEAGLAKFNGCPDSDGDGIKDSEDECPKEAGLAEFGGCPDTDGDGIKDSEDACPKEKGTKANKGCPEK